MLLEHTIPDRSVKKVRSQKDKSSSQKKTRRGGVFCCNLLNSMSVFSGSPGEILS